LKNILGIPAKFIARIAPVLLAVCLIMTVNTDAPAREDAIEDKVHPGLLAQSAEGDLDFILWMEQQADLSESSSLSSKEQKGWYVYKQLVDTANSSQKDLIYQLEELGVEYHSFWIANMVHVRGDYDLVVQLAGRPEVQSVFPNPTVPFQEPFHHPEDPLTREAQEDISAIEWNISLVRAPQVWQSGVTGQNVVIGGQDTGYDWDHPALQPHYRGWDGGIADHDYNWHDAIHSGGVSWCPENSPVPCDDHGHGTHTMGTMVGDDGGSNQIGMAPGAKWIGCRNMNRGAGTPVTYTECFQWFLAPTRIDGSEPDPTMAPDVINNSWVCPPSEGCDWDSLQTIVNNVRAAGILVVASAGNEGAGCGTVVDPPAIYDSSFSIGATQSDEQIASFSSRGPSAFTDLLKPDVSAPGYRVRSSFPVDSYVKLSGTSMAAPHVSGLAALMVSADPSLSGNVDEIETRIKRFAFPRPTTETCGGIPAGSIPNNTFGWGRIDAWGTVYPADTFFPFFWN
jgi:subtilisin family serine protease